VGQGLCPGGAVLDQEIMIFHAQRGVEDSVGGGFTLVDV
jgi:hypothetical protein